MKILWLLAFLGALQLCTAAKILVVVPMPAKSHAILFERLTSELAQRGHEVTYIAAFKLAKPHKNIKEVTLPNLHGKLTSLFGRDGDKKEQNMFEMRHMSKWLQIIILPKMGPTLMDVTLESDVMVDFLKKDQKFDLIIGEAFLDESFLGGLSYKYNAPIVGVATFMPNIWSQFWIGNPAPASYIPNPLLGYSDKMTFCERLENAVFSAVEELNHRLYYFPAQDAIMRKHFGKDLPPLIDIMTNTSLVLVNHHYSLAFPRPYLPNMIEIGGYHVHPPKPLPEDLQKYLDDSKDGFILFSMGSNLQSAQLPVELREAILKTFSRLKQNVLWKFEDENLPNLPKNVRISKWLPQSDILAHPNIKLFITHGGLLSTTEAVIRGVPLVGIPIFGDQPMNMRQVQNVGFGVALNFDDLTEETLYNAVTEVLNNPKYAENIKKGSKLLQDTPMSAMDTAIYWIEYVIRHKGARHLKSAALDLEWYQLYLLDVIGFLAIVGAVSTCMTFKVTRFVFRKVAGKFCKKCKKVDQQKKKN